MRWIVMMERVIIAALLTFLVLTLGVLVVLTDGSYNSYYDDTSTTARFFGVPPEILIGIHDEDLGIIAGYVHGRITAKADEEPCMGAIPEPYYYGYCHGYADFSELNYTTVYWVANENALASIGEEDVNHEC